MCVCVCGRGWLYCLLYLCVNVYVPHRRWQMASNVAQEIDVLCPQASSHLCLAQRMTWPITPLCHSRRGVVAQERGCSAGACASLPGHTRSSLQVFRSECAKGGGWCHRERYEESEMDSYSPGRKVKWWIWEAFKKTEKNKKLAAFYSWTEQEAPVRGPEHTAHVLSNL